MPLQVSLFKEYKNYYGTISDYLFEKLQFLFAIILLDQNEWKFYTIKTDTKIISLAGKEGASYSDIVLMNLLVMEQEIVSNSYSDKNAYVLLEETFLLLLDWAETQRSIANKELKRGILFNYLKHYGKEMRKIPSLRQEEQEQVLKERLLLISTEIKKPFFKKIFSLFPR
jgi:hypothetical protein